nr:hypothetical protein [Tanacetum cinerariifolium]
MLDEITLESLTKEQFECFMEYYRENYLEDYKSDLENLKEDQLFFGETLRKSDQLHKTFEKSSIAMTRKLDDMLKLPKSQPNRTYKEDFECDIVMVKMPKCMSWLDDEPIRDLDIMEDKVDNASPQSTLHVLPSFEVSTPPVTYSEEVEETLGIPIEVIFDDKKPMPTMQKPVVHPGKHNKQNLQVVKMVQVDPVIRLSAAGGQSGAAGPSGADVASQDSEIKEMALRRRLNTLSKVGLVRAG